MNRFPAQSRPVVLLLGWLGCNLKHLTKYSKMWQDLDAHVILHQPTILQTAWPGLADVNLLRLMRAITLRYSGLCSVRGEAPPVFVHSMSNAGFVAYGTMLHLASLLAQVRPAGLSPAPGGTAASLEFDPTAWGSGSGGMTTEHSYGLRGGGGEGLSGGPAVSSRGAGGKELHRYLSDPEAMAVLSAFRQVLGNTQGIILDSAPSLATTRIWSKGLVSALFNEAAENVGDSHPMLLRTANRLAERYFQLPLVQRRMREVRTAWQVSVPPCPQLYLYSRADALIPHRHIERFMEQQAAHGVPVQSHCWTDTPHCEHLRKHPAQYKGLVRSFAEHCLHSHSPPESWI